MVTRRTFVAAPLIVPARALGRGATPPSDRISIGIIGSGNRALFEGKHYVALDECQVVALCDVQETRRNEAQAKFEKAYAARGASGKGMRLFGDFRELLARKDVDAVYIVTPDHWHVPILIAAVKAGKAVHQEKPLGLSIEQDLAALKAVKKYKRPFFYGPERRSTADARHAIELVLNGRIGKVKEIVVAAPPSVAGGNATPTPVPNGFDFDMWLGPAPAAPFCPDRVAGGMFHIADYCLGFIANWGAHPLDLVQWWADNSGLTIPVRYEGAGRLPESGLYNCAVQWDLRCTYENGLIMRYMDGRTLSTRDDVPAVLGPAGRRLNNTACFVGTEGAVAVCYERVMTEPASLANSEIAPNEIHLKQSPRDPGRVTAKGIWDYPAAAHQLAWIESLRDKQPGLHSIETAVHTDLVCQLADICIRAGRPIVWDPKGRKIAGDAEAAKMASKPMRKPWDASLAG
jgi:predicted dehydrogenase